MLKQEVIEIGKESLFERIEDLPETIGLRFLGIQVGSSTVVFRSAEILSEKTIAVDGEAVVLKHGEMAYLWLERGIYRTGEEVREIIAVSPSMAGD